MTGHGGWPLNVVPHARPGAVLRRDLLPARATPGHAELAAGARGDRRRLERAPRRDPRAGAGGSPSGCAARRALRAVRRADRPRPRSTRRWHAAQAYDRQPRRLRRRPKFPPPRRSSSCSPAASARCRSQRCGRWPRGGIHDQVGGGFARYAVDALDRPALREDALRQRAARARLPARLAGRAATRCCAASCEETLDSSLRELRGPEGGFYSALDADSEGEEGKFYVWSLDELREALGGRRRGGDRLLRRHGAGNFEGTNVLESRGPAAAEQRDAHPRAAAEVREQRVRPGLDDKRLTAWNALRSRALADAGARLEREDYLAAARASADFLLARPARRPRPAAAHLERTARRKLNAYLEDHAFLLEALLVLYEATFEPRWFAAARELADTIIERFADPEQRRVLLHLRRPRAARRAAQGPRGQPHPVGLVERGARPPAPRGAHRRGHLRAPRPVRARLVHVLAPRHPQAFGHLLQALDFPSRPPREVALAGEDRERARAGLRERAPARGRAGRRRGRRRRAAAEGRTPVDGRAAAYVCERFACRRPVTDPGELAALLSSGD